MDKEGLSNLERRRFPRLKDNIFIFGNLRSSPAEEFKAIAEDISAGGLMFQTEGNIFEENELQLEVYQPINRDKIIIFSVPILAKVKWTTKIEKNNFEDGENKYRVGIEFSKIEEEDRQKIINYVEENKS